MLFQSNSGVFFGGCAVSFDGRKNIGLIRATAWVTVLFTAWLFFPRAVFARPRSYTPVSQLAAKGLTQTPDAALLKKIEAREKREREAAHKPTADVEPLSVAEMGHIRGRGPYRNAYFAGSPMPWHRSLRDVNVCNGNLFKSFTDVQVAPGRGAGLVLQRTYNSNDDRSGPFGTGWTHAYDIRMEEAGTVTDTDSNGAQLTHDVVPRVDFFGGRHKYARDADGLYTPPAYLYDETDSRYDASLADGVQRSLEDSERGMDGTVKHFVPEGTDAGGRASKTRVCDYIEDRYGNRTVLTYGLPITLPDGSLKNLLTKVTDPTGRFLTFTWQNLGTAAAPAWRIMTVQSPLYAVTYEYYTNASDASSYLSLWKVHLDSGGMDRVTTYAYTTCQGETGLLASITDPLGRAVAYEYGLIPYSSVPPYVPNSRTTTLWVNKITEPGTAATPHIWTVTAVSYGSFQFTSNAGLTVYPYSDPSGRINSLQYLANQGSQPDFVWNYYEDYTNNCYKSLKLSTGSYDGIQSVAGLQTLRTFGPHGNVLKEWFQGQDNTNSTTYTYYNASKYFQKASVTDALGRTTRFDYFGNEIALFSSVTTPSGTDSHYTTPVNPSGDALTAVWKVGRPEFTGSAFNRVAFGWLVSGGNHMLNCCIDGNGYMQIVTWGDCVGGGVAQASGSDSYWNSAQFAAQDTWYLRARWSTASVGFDYSFDGVNWVVIAAGTAASFGFPTRPDRAAISVGNGSNAATTARVRFLGYSDGSGAPASPDPGAWTWLNQNGAVASLGSRGNVAWVRDAGYDVSGSPSYNKQFTYTYYPSGQKASETNLNGVVTNYTYGDSYGNLTQVAQDPGGLNRVTSMVYDGVGRVTASTDPNGQTSTFSYNKLGQPTAASFPAKGNTPAETVSYVYGANGRTESVTDGRGTTGMAYEPQADRVAGVTDPVTGTTSYTYGVSGERASLTLPGGGTLLYEYKPSVVQYPGSGQEADKVSRVLSKITDDQGRVVLVTTDGFGRLLRVRHNIAFNAGGALVQYLQNDYVYDRYTVTENGSSAQDTHDWLIRTSTTWKSQQTTNPQSSLLNQNDYAYSVVGQRISNTITQPGAGGALASRTENYTYDELSRLKTANYGDGEVQTYGFDAMGNRLAKTDNVTGSEGYTFDNANRIATRQVGASAVQSYTSDADGNTLTDGKHTNAWDSQNLLASCATTGTNANTSTFAYGADGLRRKMSVTNAGQAAPNTITHYGYDGTSAVREWAEDPLTQVRTIAATYLLGPSGPMYADKTQFSSKRPTNAADVRWFASVRTGTCTTASAPWSARWT